jgi:hypothetical protein
MTSNGAIASDKFTRTQSTLAPEVDAHIACPDS